MPDSKRYTFTKQERITSRKLLEQLFMGGHRSMSAFPLRVVFMTRERAEGEPPVQVLVSVSKRHFKRAVKRNRVKRQIREAYRLNKYILWDALQDRPDTAVAVAFLWLADELHDSQSVTASVTSLLRRIAEKI